ncbi:MAG: IS481 family transposase [Planctomycetes bacterium]|nr:IS481 family transposase [Planctomycetota bacterium]QKK11524.1 MAG: transposase [Pseudomonadota bacterium]QKK11838.1 MAG: transposase [Pseudomonadota bacterium]QKK12425.1 MAG: transposase [Pseudomonadota bacterium]
MPWKETCAMDQRVQFIGDWLSDEYTKSALCAWYGISRPTGDKWIKRYEALGVVGLEERSRAPRHHPNATPEALCTMIIEVKLAHPGWGPKKVLDYLRAHQPRRPWPADSTGGEILRRAGLVVARRRKHRVAPDSVPFRACGAANDTWSIDFKGDFRLGNTQRCYPLTVSDNFSRYLLQCRALSATRYSAVQPWLQWTFREYGLPRAIRTDNGAPFASRALGGLSQLSKWWVRLGIKPERIRPGQPSQNGRHERMHRTLKADGVHPIRASLSAQQRQFNTFVSDYNWERSHEALGRATPGSVYCASPRAYPTKLPMIEYDTTVTVRRVRHNGEIKWRGEYIYLSEVLAQEPVGLTPIDEEHWEVRFSFHRLGILNQRTKQILMPKQWHHISD